MTDIRDRTEQLARRAEHFKGRLAVPDWLPVEAGESLYYLAGPVELIELRDTALPLVGGVSELVVADALGLTAWRGGRSVRVQEDVPGRETGWLAVTDRRVHFVSPDRNREWPFDVLMDVVHDTQSPETWLPSRNHKVMAGLRYPAQQAVDARFAIAVALAEARGTRWHLAASLRAQVEQGKRPAWVWVRNAYVGRPGRALPGRVAQGVVTSLATLALLGTVLPDPPEDTTAAEVTQSSLAKPDETQAPETDESTQAAEDAAAADAEAAAAAEAAAERARREALTKQTAARAAAAQRRAAEAKAAADRAAAQRAAQQKAAQEAAAREAAERAAAQQASAEQPAEQSSSGCTPEYPDFCIPYRPGDAYNCGDFSEKDFTALAPDPYRLDRDQDGIACES